MRPVTAREVAEKVGVSVSTVSRALSAPSRVAPTTRALVRHAAAELGYTPRSAGRPGRRAGQQYRIGLVVPDLENPHFATLAQGLLSRGRAVDARVLVADCEGDPMVEREIHRFFDGHVDGLVLASPRTPATVLQEWNSRTPLVLVHSRIEGISSVTVDDADGARHAARHLLALGHRRVAWVGGPPQSWTSPRRYGGLREVFERAPEAELLDLGMFPATASAGAAAADQALALGVTAVVAFNDVVALGLIERAHRRGVHLPEDLSVVGFDGVPGCGLVNPTLTSVASDARRMGRASIESLISAIDGSGSGPVYEQLPLELVVRNSTSVADTAAVRNGWVAGRSALSETRGASASLHAQPASLPG